MRRFNDTVETKVVLVAAIVVLAVIFNSNRIGALREVLAAQNSPDYNHFVQQPHDTAAAPLAGFELPQGYRDWALISVAFVGAPVNDIRAKLGNDIAIADLRQGTIPYRNGAIIARLAWKQVHDPQTNNALQLQAKQVGLSEDAIAKLLAGSAVAGPPTNVQFMIKDSTKYASTGGWGFAQFTNGKPDAITPNTCFACHEPARSNDFIFTRYAP